MPHPLRPPVIGHPGQEIRQPRQLAGRHLIKTRGQDMNRASRPGSSGHGRLGSQRDLFLGQADVRYPPDLAEVPCHLQPHTPAPGP